MIAEIPATQPATPAAAQRIAPTAQASRWFRVRWWHVVAAGFMGLFLGLYLGIVITVTHRDGTTSTLIFPDVKKVEITETTKDATSATKPSDPTATPTTVVDARSAPPLEFALLVPRQSLSQGPSISPAKLQEALDLLHKSRSDAVTQFESYRFVTMPDGMQLDSVHTAWNNGVRYALISTYTDHMASWATLP